MMIKNLSEHIIAIILYIFMMLFECCEMCSNDINRENINNPQVYVTEDSVFEYRYYLTTEQGELATTFARKENLVVHLDISNIGEEDAVIDRDMSNPVYYEFATCYDEQGNVVSRMSYTPLYLVTSDSVNVKVMPPHTKWRHSETFNVKTGKGSYYYRARPVLMTADSDRVGSYDRYRHFELQIPFVVK